MNGALARISPYGIRRCLDYGGARTDGLHCQPFAADSCARCCGLLKTNRLCGARSVCNLLNTRKRSEKRRVCGEWVSENEWRAAAGIYVWRRFPKKALCELLCVCECVHMTKRFAHLRLKLDIFSTTAAAIRYGDKHIHRSVECCRRPPSSSLGRHLRGRRAIFDRDVIRQTEISFRPISTRTLSIRCRSSSSAPRRRISNTQNRA